MPLDPTQPDVTDVPDTDDVEVNVGDHQDPTLPPAPYDHYENLALKMDDRDLNDIASDLVEEIEADMESRKGFLAIKAKAIREQGFDRTADTRSVPFEGASNAVHPLLATCATDISSRTTAEIWGINGPCAADIAGKSTPENVARAKRVQDHMNWQLHVGLTGFKEQFHILLKKNPLDGTTYLKNYWDERLGSQNPTYVPVEQLIVPYYANSLGTAERITHRIPMTRRVMKRNIRNGMFRDVAPSEPTSEPVDAVTEASDRVQGRTPPADLPGQSSYFVLECHTYWDLGEVDPKTGDTEMPYIISIEQESKKILAISRNWREPVPGAPPKRAVPRTYFTRFIHEPWEGILGIGLPHQIGGLSAAATSAMRALLDAAMLNNTTIWAMTDNTGMSGEKITTAPNSIIRFKPKGRPNASVNDLVQRLQFSEPSAVLFQLLGFMVEAGQNYSNVNLAQITDMSPSGTSPAAMLALLDQGMTVFNAMFFRIRESFGQFLQTVYDLNREHLSEETFPTAQGMVTVTAADYADDLIITPACDIRGGSQMRRLAQNAMLMQMAENQLLAPHFKIRSLLSNTLQGAGIDPEDVMVDPPEDPARMDPASNIMRALEGRPVKLFPDQDPDPHLAMISVVFRDPMIGGNPDLAGMAVAKLTPFMLQCIVRRMAKMYGHQVMAVASSDPRNIPPAVLQQLSQMPPDQRQALLRPMTILDQKLPDAITDWITDIVSDPRTSDAFLRAEGISASAIEPILQRVKAMLPPPAKDPVAVSAQAEADAEKSRHELGLLGLIKDAQEIESNERISENAQAQANVRALIGALKALPPGIDLFGHLPDDVPDQVKDLFMQAQELLRSGAVPTDHAAPAAVPSPPSNPMPSVPTGVPAPGSTIASDALHSRPPGQVVP